MCGLHSGLQSLGLRVSKPCRNWISKSAVRPFEFDNEMRELGNFVDRFTRRPKDFQWQPHPQFGQMFERVPSHGSSPSAVGRVKVGIITPIIRDVNSGSPGEMA
jgi:hypothetical protein